jgi:hypothetical protein
VTEALARLLTVQRVRAWAAAFLGLGMAGWLAVVVAGRPPLDAFGKPVAVDFTAHYTAGRMALEGEWDRLYDPLVQRSHQRTFLGQGERWAEVDVYLSPPVVALGYAPLARLPYLVAAVLWELLTVAALLAALWLLWPLLPGLHRFGRATYLVVALSAQPVLELLGDGQDAGVALLVLVGGLRLLLAGRDFAAGCVLGLGACKPQLFFLLPVVLLVEGRWRALLGGTLVAAALVGGSALLVGRAGLAAYAALLAGGAYRPHVRVEKMLSLPALAQALLPVGRVALVAVTAGIAAALAGSLALAARRAPPQPGRLPRLYALAVLSTVLASPHLFLYDGVVLIVPAAIGLEAAGDRPALPVAVAATYLLLWTTPLRQAAVLGRPALHLVGAPWAALGILALFLIARRYALAGTAKPLR